MREVMTKDKETTYDVYLNMEPVHGINVSGETRSVDALTRMRLRSTDSYRYAAPEHEVSRKCD